MAQLLDAINKAQHGERTIFRRKSGVAFAVVPVEDAEYMEYLEDELDNKLADEALADKEDKGISIESLMKRYDLGK